MIFYFYGENSFAIGRQVSLIKQKYLQKTGQDADYMRIDLAESKFSDLVNSVRAVPMFVTSRLVVVDNLSALKIDVKDIEELIHLVPESTNLVFIDTNADKRTAVFKLLAQLKGAKEFKNPKPQELKTWMNQEIKKRSLKAGFNLADYLIERSGTDQWRLSGELDKLTASGEELSKELVDNLVVPNLETSSFELAEALVKKDLQKALKLYEELKLQSQADQMIFGAIVYQYRMLLIAKLDSPQLRAAYKASPYSLQKAKHLSQETDLEEVKSAFLFLRQADMASKSGELSSAEAMKQLFLNLCK